MFDYLNIKYSIIITWLFVAAFFSLFGKQSTPAFEVPKVCELRLHHLINLRNDTLTSCQLFNEVMQDFLHDKITKNTCHIPEEHPDYSLASSRRVPR